MKFFLHRWAQTFPVILLETTRLKRWTNECEQYSITIANTFVIALCLCRSFVNKQSQKSVP
ncbi:hypothetical protein COOONC_07439 [Cooperia oncophora]